MPIKPYLAGREFAPQTIAVMNAAFTGSLRDAQDRRRQPFAGMVAQTIILLAEGGETNAELAATAVKEMRGTKRATA